MARTIGMESLLQKIDLAQARVIKTKAVYDEAVGDLQILLNKQDALSIMSSLSRHNFQNLNVPNTMVRIFDSTSLLACRSIA